MCLNFGVTGLADLYQHIEHQAKEGISHNMNEPITRLQEEFALATSILQGQLSTYYFSLSP